jgi:hypothetical protein
MFLFECARGSQYQALHALAEQFGEPTWDRARGEFYYRFRLSEPYPRGQANAVIMAAEAGGKQAWWRILTSRTCASSINRPSPA